MQNKRMFRAYTEEDKVAQALLAIIGTKAAPCVLHARLCTVDAELYECGTEDDPEQDVAYDTDGAAIEDRYFRLYHPDDLGELLDYVREYPEPSDSSMGPGSWLTDRAETFSDTWEERSFHFEDIQPVDAQDPVPDREQAQAIIQAIVRAANLTWRDRPEPQEPDLSHLFGAA